MSARSSGQIITFYSYKGGVGRTAALANVAVLLAQQGRSVLAIDFDLEAPGLHRYFPVRGLTQETAEASTTTRGGVIDFFLALRSEVASTSAAEAEAHEDDPQARASVRDRIRALLDSGSFLEGVHVRDPNRPKATATLTLMAAGRFDDGYPARVRGFDWRALYDEFPLVLEELREELSARFEYILIDSRTGITDAGGVCTALLPHKLVLVFSPNEQSLHGAVQIGRQAALYRAALDDGRAMPLFPLPSRIENAEEEQTSYWLHEARRRFEPLFRELYGADSGSLETYFEQIRIPHRPYYAFGEKIAAERSRESESQSLAEAFGRFVRQLSQGTARASTSGGAPPPVASSSEGAGLLVIAIGGDSLWPAVNASRGELGLAEVPERDVLDFSTGYLDADVDRWTALAADVRDRVRPWVDDPRYEHFHLFYRGPVVLAPLLGALIVPSKPVSVYYYENGRYHLALTYDKRFVGKRGPSVGKR